MDVFSAFVLGGMAGMFAMGVLMHFGAVLPAVQSRQWWQKHAEEVLQLAQKIFVQWDECYAERQELRDRLATALWTIRKLQRREVA